MSHFHCVQKSCLNILPFILCFIDERKVRFGMAWGCNTNGFNINRDIEGNRRVEQWGKASLWSQNGAEAKNRGALALFPQTTILVEQIRKTIHRLEDFPLADVIQRLSSFCSQHEPDLHEICFVTSERDFILPQFSVSVFSTVDKNTRYACLQKLIVLPSRCSVGHVWLITAEMCGPIGSQISLCTLAADVRRCVICCMIFLKVFDRRSLKHFWPAWRTVHKPTHCLVNVLLISTNGLMSSCFPLLLSH